MTKDTSAKRRKGKRCLMSLCYSSRGMPVTLNDCRIYTAVENGPQKEIESYFLVTLKSRSGSKSNHCVVC